jgi:hypothetical protein|tara:strand:+ start:208 stop:429 length:222 start_codon:yes stop_codon:yes gene_type:complete
MKKHLLPHILIVSFVFLLAPTAHVVSYAGEIEFYKEEVRKNPDDALALLISAFSTVPGVWQLRGTQGISILED